MEKVTLKGLDKEVSRIGLGTWAIGGWLWGGTDERRSIETILAALERGITLIDTAPVYGFGVSEEIVGKALKEFGSRDEVVVSTKVGLEWSDGKVFRNSTPERIRKEVEDSLRRLGVERIDIYHVHWPDPLVPYEKTAETLQKLKEEGKIAVAGVSNYDPEQMEAFRKETELSVLQPPYNLFERGIESEILPYCRKPEGKVALMTYGALCRGLLSGRMTPETTFGEGDLRRWDPKFSEPRFDQYLEAVRRLDELARERHGKRVIHLAVRWILDQGVEMALWGGRSPEQLEPVDEMMGWSLTEEDLQAIDAVLEETVRDPVGPEFMAPPTRG